MITGIAGKKGFSVITMTKNGMSSELGVIRRVLEILERYHINVEYIPSGIDSVSLVVETGKAAPYLYQALGDMEKEIKPDSLHVTDGSGPEDGLPARFLRQDLRQAGRKRHQYPHDHPGAGRAEHHRGRGQRRL